MAALELTVGKVYAHKGRFVVALVLRAGPRLVWYDDGWKTAPWDDLEGGQQDVMTFVLVGSWGITTRELDAFLQAEFYGIQPDVQSVRRDREPDPAFPLGPHLRPGDARGRSHQGEGS